MGHRLKKYTLKPTQDLGGFPTYLWSDLQFMGIDTSHSQVSRMVADGLMNIWKLTTNLLTDFNRYYDSVAPIKHIELEHCKYDIIRQNRAIIGPMLLLDRFRSGPGTYWNVWGQVEPECETISMQRGKKIAKGTTISQYQISRYICKVLVYYKWIIMTKHYLIFNHGYTMHPIQYFSM